jgi:hypothetical protein
MNLTCPDCGFHAPFVVYAADEDGRRIADLVAQMPKGVGRAALFYINLFAPAKRKLTLARARKLLEQLAPDIARGAIERDGRHWLAPDSVWLQAMEYMQEPRASLKLPLKSHGYLYEVIVGLVDAKEAAAEQATELQRRTGQRSGVAPEPARIGQPPQMVDEERRYGQARRLVGTLLSRMDEDRRRKLPVRELEDYANDYRGTFGDAVVDTAIREAQSRLASRPESA